MRVKKYAKIRHPSQGGAEGNERGKKEDPARPKRTKPRPESATNFGEAEDDGDDESDEDDDDESFGHFDECLFFSPG